MRLMDVNQYEELKDLYVEYYLKLIKIHELKAEELGIEDKVCKNYTKEKALKHLDDCKCFIIFNDENTHVGMITYKFISDDFGDIVTFIKSIFIDEEHRNKGYATEVIKYLMKKYDKLRLECWYGLPAMKLYTKLGFKEMYRVYEFGEITNV